MKGYEPNILCLMCLDNILISDDALELTERSMDDSDASGIVLWH